MILMDGLKDVERLAEASLDVNVVMSRLGRISMFTYTFILASIGAV